MGLQQCFSRGGKVVLTNFLPRNFKQFRHLFGVGLPERTQRWNNTNINSVNHVFPRYLMRSSTKCQCFKTPSCNYSKIHKETKSFKSSSVQDDDVIDDDEEEENDEEEDDSDDDSGSHYISRAERERLDFQVGEIFTNKKEMSSTEWEETIKLMSRANFSVTPMSCDAITMKRCVRHNNYTLAVSYMEHLQRQGREPNLSTLGNYLQLCGQQVDQCGEDQVLQLYRQLMSQVKILDVRLCKNVILGLTATQEWRLALDHLAHFRKMASSWEEVYSAIITAAFRAGDYEMGWQYLTHLREQDQNPMDSVFLEWVRQCEAEGDEAERKAKALTLLQKLESHEVYPSVAVVKAMTHLFRDTLGWSAHFLKMPKSGACPACRHQLDTKAVSEEEFRNLREEFVPRVLVRSDIFRSTSPEEWEDFKAYVEERKPFSVVVDGLNASYILNKRDGSMRMKSLRDVVEQALMRHPSDRILVLGRHHMMKWIKKMRWNKHRVDFYTLNNMTKDDGFFLYTALQSGLGTKFVTNDLLRDHVFRLGEVPLRDAFRRWQRNHQVMAYSSAGCVRLASPAKFSTVAQASQANGEGCWHVPYDDGEPRLYHELPLTWLCLHPSLTLAPSLPLTVSREPLTYNGSRNTTTPSPLAAYQRLIPAKDSRGDRERGSYGTPPRERKQRGKDEDEMGGFRKVNNKFSYSIPLPRVHPVAPSRFPPKRKKAETSVGKVNLNAIFSDDDKGR